MQSTESWENSKVEGLDRHDVRQHKVFVSFQLTVCVYTEVTNVEIDMEGQKVLVTSTLTSDEILAKIQKTGRECSYAGVNN